MNVCIKTGFRYTYTVSIDRNKNSDCTRSWKKHSSVVKKSTLAWKEQGNSIDYRKSKCQVKHSHADLITISELTFQEIFFVCHFEFIEEYATVSFDLVPIPFCRGPSSSC